MGACFKVVLVYRVGAAGIMLFFLENILRLYINIAYLLYL